VGCRFWPTLLERSWSLFGAGAVALNQVQTVVCISRLGRAGHWRRLHAAGRRNILHGPVAEKWTGVVVATGSRKILRVAGAPCSRIFRLPRDRDSAERQASAKDGWMVLRERKLLANGLSAGG